MFAFGASKLQPRKFLVGTPRLKPWKDVSNIVPIRNQSTKSDRVCQELLYYLCPFLRRCRRFIASFFF